MVFLKKSKSNDDLDRTTDGTFKTLSGKTMYIGVGAMKAGTTWISQYLKNHPEACHSNLKEMNFFNTLVPHIGRSDGAARRAEIINKLILRYPPPKRISSRARKKIYDVAEIGQFNKDRNRYLEYFATRIGKCPVFGEISPSYSTLPPDGFQNIIDAHPDTRIFLIMRDPTARAVSHIQHGLRRQQELDVDARIETIAIGNAIYERGNYPQTLRSIAKGAPDCNFMTMIFEEMFNENSIRDFCGFLGISYRKPDFERVANNARTKQLTDDQKLRIRHKLAPIYDEIHEILGDNRPAKWLWQKF